MTLRVYTFTPAWGLPAGGPFDMKLLSWLRLAGIAYEQVHEDDTRKGPKKKNPWVELDGEPIADTELIIDRLRRRFDIDLDDGLDWSAHAIGHAWRRTFEEHFHQVLEWELMIHDAGARFMRQRTMAAMPPVMGRLVFSAVRRHMGRQLHARGLARHAPDVIAAKGRADLDALETFMGERPYLLGERPTGYDAAVFGLLSPVIYWSMPTPVALHARALPGLKAYCDRMLSRCFGADR